MCGIIGFVGPGKHAVPILLEGLSRLEYRGYDSAGLAVVDPAGGFHLQKAVGRLDMLRQAVDESSALGDVGIGHTRWATHGRPTEDNAHPHLDCTGRIAVVQNGIVENYLPLKRDLQAAGHTFSSQTDTEVIPHLIEEELNEGAPLEAATRQALARTVGAMSLLIAFHDYPQTLIGLRTGNAGGLVIGYGDSEMHVASDLPALLPHTRSVSYLAPGEGTTVTSDGARFWTLDGAPLERSPQTIAQDPIAAAKEGYKHFMLKEIHQQPDVVADVLGGRVDMEALTLRLEELDPIATKLAGIRRVLFTACGTSLHAAMLGQRYMESIAGLPAEAEVASELRYRDAILGPDTLVVSISQSGETADTLAAMEMAKEQGALQITLTNIDGSQSTRVADATLPLRSGLEVGVASTKTFMASLVTLHLLAIQLGTLRGHLSGQRAAELISDLARLPHLLGDVVARAPEYEDLARRYHASADFLYLGRSHTYPIALEGALKLKELTYIHAEGYAGGEMKHGPIALIDENMPVVAIALQDELHDKMLSNVEEVLARDGKVIALLTDGDDSLAGRADGVMTVPHISRALSPLLATVPLQFFAYYIGVLRGADVDQPRNLAKSVTVE